MFRHFYLAILIIFLFMQNAFSSIIKYEEILENPTDLELNLNYAKQQEEAGNFKLTIATLERMIMLYPTNPDIKIYLLSILIKMDSPAKVELMVQSMVNDPNTTDETKNLIASLLSDSGIEDKKKSAWFAYLDLSYSQTQETNVDAITKTNKMWNNDEELKYTDDSLRADKSYKRGSSFTVGKNIDSTSSFLFNLGLTINQQDKASSDESDIGSGSLSYFKIIDKHYIAPYVYYSRPNNNYAKDSNTKGVGLSNTYIIDEKQSLNYSLGYSVLHNNTYSKYTTANHSNNHTYSSNIKYNYNISKKNQISTKFSFSEINANNDIYSYDSYGLSLAYAHILPFGTLKLQSSYIENEYETKDTFHNTTIDRKDKPFVNSIGLTGQINQIFPFLKKFNQDNTLLYSLNLRHSDVSSSLLNHDTERQFFTIGLTKRVNFNFNK